MTAADASRPRLVLASLLQAAGQELPPTLRRVLQYAPDGFHDAELGAIARAIHKASSNGTVPDLVAIGENLSADHLSTFSILANSNEALPIALAELEAEALLAEMQSRRVTDTLGEAWQEAREHPAQVNVIARHAIAALQSLDAERPRRTEDLPPMVDAASFLATPLPQPPELIAGVLHQGSKLVLGGASKSFKTWTLLDLAISVAHGLDWLGFPTKSGRVLYVNFEIQDAPWQRRLASVARAKSCEIQPGQITLWNLRGKAADFQTLLPQVTARARSEGFALIILDPIYKLYGRTDENKAGDVAALLNGIEALTVEAGAAVAFGAHFSKGNQANKEAIDRISGSGVFARDPDSILIFTAHEEPNAYTVEPILRNFPPIDPFAVRFDFPLMRRDDQLDRARLKQTSGGRKPGHDPKRLLACISDTTPKNPVSIAEWSLRANLPRTTLLTYVEDMRVQGLIATIGEGQNARRYITEKGRNHLPKQVSGIILDTHSRHSTPGQVSGVGNTLVPDTDTEAPSA